MLPEFTIGRKVSAAVATYIIGIIRGARPSKGFETNARGKPASDLRDSLADMAVPIESES